MIKLALVALLALYPIIAYAQPLANWQWKKTDNISYSDIEYRNGYLYATGNFTDSVVQVGGNTFSNMGNSDIVISKSDTQGNLIWVKHFGGTGDDKTNNLTVDKYGQIYITGTFTNQLNINGAMLFSVDSADIFFIKLDGAYNINPIQIVENTVSCNDYLYHGNTYTSSGVYYDTLSVAGGCDLFFVLNLTIHQGSNFSMTQTIVDSFALNGQTYYSPGIYTQTWLNAVGCDSVVTLNLLAVGTGSSQYSEGTLFKIFPNPANNILFTEYTFDQDRELIIYNSCGQKIRSIGLEKGKRNLSIQISDFTNGLYYFRCTGNGEKDLKGTFIVQN